MLEKSSQIVSPFLPRPLLCLIRLLTLVIFLGLFSCSEEKKSPEIELSTEEQIEGMILTEELVQKLTPDLRALAASMVSGSRDGLPLAVADRASLAPWSGLDPSHRWTSA